MTQEENKLLLIDLCARLPYGINCVFHSKKGDISATLVAVDYERGIVHIKPIKQSVVYCYFVEDDNIPKPYLRPMPSMTEEEKKVYRTMSAWGYILESKEHRTGIYPTIEGYKWLNANHFDYNHLIEKGLALPAPEGLYTH